MLQVSCKLGEVHRKVVTALEPVTGGTYLRLQLSLPDTTDVRGHLHYQPSILLQRRVLLGGLSYQTVHEAQGVERAYMAGCREATAPGMVLRVPGVFINSPGEINGEGREWIWEMRCISHPVQLAVLRQLPPHGKVGAVSALVDGGASCIIRKGDYAVIKENDKFT